MTILQNPLDDTGHDADRPPYRRAVVQETVQEREMGGRNGGCVVQPSNSLDTGGACVWLRRPATAGMAPHSARVACTQPPHFPLQQSPPQP